MPKRRKITTNQHCVTSQKSEGLVYTAAETLNHLRHICALTVVHFLLSRVQRNTGYVCSKTSITLSTTPATYFCTSFILYFSLLGAFTKLREATISFVMSVRLSACNNSALTGRIFMKFYILRIFENMSTKFKFHKNLIRITGILHEDRYASILYIAEFFLE